jgi:lipopolysaccharide transport system ATP-binding protein
MKGEVLVKAEGVSKKFCKDLKRSLFYGVQDIATELFGFGASDKLRKNEFWAVNEVSFELRRGECLGLIGHNGAGKSTLLKVLNGLIKPDEGEITMKGRVGALIELGAGFNPILTGRENIYNNGAVLGFTKKEIDAKFDAIVEFSEIEDFIDTPVQNYSSGMKVRLGFAVAAQMEPDVLIIDEVLAVGDVGFKIKCLNRISSLLNRSAVIFVSHNMVQLSSICNKGILLERGTVYYQSSRVDAVIEQYNKLTTNTSCNIIGSENMMIDNICLKNAENIETNTVKYNEDLLLSFDLKIYNVDLKRIGIYCTIWDNEYKPIIDVITESDSRLIINVNKQLYSIQLNIPHLILNFGKHLFTIHVYDENSNERVFRIDHIAPFFMDFVFTSGAACIKKGEWHLV